MVKITKRVVEAAEAREKDHVICDDELPGFGLRVFSSGKRSYVIQYRIRGRSRRYTIGLHGAWAPETARREAKVQLGRSCVARRRADLPETGPRSSQPVLARTTDVSASSLLEAPQPTTQASLQSTLPAPTIFESWLPMDSEIFIKGNCNARHCAKPLIQPQTTQMFVLRYAGLSDRSVAAPNALR
jgi:hypothetical protein